MQVQAAMIKTIHICCGKGLLLLCHTGDVEGGVSNATGALKIMDGRSMNFIQPQTTDQDGDGKVGKIRATNQVYC